ncbi:hydantoin racemase [Enterococcus ureilyticus]|uniref:Hydantoin racemase n=1 Tax=Enterococcus ureilyticus TaxID=1131292 RepID=A0A1E5H9Y0_9ENTE|nr:aspartate/glutamate racemase family protein [Enterococcus ureilyticus]MBM7688540.1 allantoin racemase [Enterococcus ureilyticus]OEG21635.1 hydantoin racemase [Enterococcus ureilyticus]
MKIIVANPNSNTELTKVLMKSAEKGFNDSSTELIPYTNPKGSKHIDCTFGDYQSVWSFVRGLLDFTEEVNPDAIVLAGFGNFGFFALKEALDIPVISIAEGSQVIATMLGHKYSILTVFKQNIPYQEDLTHLLRLEGKLASVRGIEMDTENVNQNSSVKESLKNTIIKMIEEDGAEAIVLGGARFAMYADSLSEEIGVPVIDPVSVSVKLAKLFVECHLSQSKIGKFNYPPQKISDYFVD